MKISWLRLFVFILFFGQTHGSSYSSGNALVADLPAPTNPKIIKVNTDISLYYSTIEFVFNQPMQRVDRKALPIKTTPHFSCSWFWTDARHLACNLSQLSTIKPATAYQIEIKEGLYSREGIALQPYSYHFEVARPAIDSIRISDWKSINEPEILIHFNLGIVPQSLENRLYLVAPSGEKIAVEMEPVKNQENNASGQLERWLKNSQWKLLPKEKLKEGLTYYLLQEPGIMTSFGKLVSKKQRLKKPEQVIINFGKFKYLGYECREYNQSKQQQKGICTPGQGIALKFSTPVAQQSLDYCKDKLEKKGVKITKSRYKKTELIVIAAIASKNIPLTCLDQLTDIFGRALTKKTKIEIETSDFTSAHWNNHKQEVLSDKDELVVKYHSLNNEQLNMVIYSRNHERLNKQQDSKYKTAFAKAELKYKKAKNKVVSFDIISKKYKDSTQMSGAISTPGERADRVARFDVQKSKYNITLQRSASQLLVFVSDIHDNFPVVNRKFNLVIKHGKKKIDYESQTNRDGIAIIKVSDHEYLYPDQYLFTFNGKDKARINYDFTLQPKINNKTNNDGRPHDGEKVLWGATDKPIYRPGEVVKYTAFVREINGDKTELTSLRKKSMAYISGQGIYCYKTNCDSFYINKKLKLSRYGKFSDEFTLPKSIADGKYTLQLKTHNGRVQTQSDLSFIVANFKRQAVKVDLKLSQKTLTSEDELSTLTRGSYYSGGPYNNAESSLDITVNNKNLNEIFPKHNRFYFDANSCKTCRIASHSMVQTGRLDKEGVSVNKSTLPKNNIYYGQISVKSQIKLDSGEILMSPAKEVPYYPRPYFVGIKKNSWWLSGSTPIKIESRVIDVDGNIIPNIKVTYYLLKNDHSWELMRNNQTPKKPETITCINAFTNTICEFTANVTGHYQLIARITYADGETQQSKTSHYFYNDEKNDEKKLVINTDHSQLKVGERATLKINHPYQSASALITIHRNKLLKSWWQPLTQGLNEISFDVKENYAPGFDVTVFVNYGKLSQLEKKSTTEFSLAATQRFNVENHLWPSDLMLVTEKSSYRPSESVTVKLKNTDKTEVDITLLMIDQSILDQISDDSYLSVENSVIDTQSINWDNPGFYQLVKKLYSARRDEKNMKQIILEENSMLMRLTGSRLSPLNDDSNKPFYPRKKKASFTAQSNDNLLFDPSISVGNVSVNLNNLRRTFKESAYWDPSIVVPAGRMVEVKIKLPDNLTEWKIIAIVANKKGGITTTDTRIKTQKAIEVRSEIPPQLIVGDQFFHQPYAVPRSPKLDSLKLSSAAQDIRSNKTLAEGMKTFGSIKPFGRYSMSLPIHAELIGTTEILTVADASSKDDMKFQDAMLQTIAILGKDINRSQTQYSVLPKDRLIKFDKPQFSSNNQASIQFKTSGSLLSQLSATNEYMKDYPHQCWEQKSSRALVAALQLKSKNYQKDEKTILEANIKDAINSISEFQAASGGISFFGRSNDSVSIYLSAYSYLVIQRMKKIGHDFPDYNVDKLKTYLKRLITKEIVEDRYTRNPEKLKTPQKILVLNALSQDPKSMDFVKKQLKSIIEKNEIFDVFTQGQLLELTARISNLKSFSMALSKKILENTRVTNKKRLLIKNKQMPWYYYDFDAKKYCSVISGLTEQSFDQKIIYQLINGALEKRRNHKGDFGNTLSNAYCAMAINDYVAKYEINSDANNRKTNSNEIIIELQGKPLTISLKNSTNRTNIDLKGTLAAEITDKPLATVYLESKLIYQVDASMMPPISNGFSLQRSYQVYRENKWINLTDENASQGDYIKVRLVISNPLFRRYVALTDKLAGGFFALDENLATSAPHQLFESLEQNFYFNEKQLGAKDARFYANYLPAGTYVMEYLVKASHQGDFAALAASVEEMYDDDVFASTKGIRVIIH